MLQLEIQRYHVRVTMPHWGIGAQIAAVASWFHKTGEFTAELHNQFTNRNTFPILFQDIPVAPNNIILVDRDETYLPINFQMPKDKLDVMRSNVDRYLVPQTRWTDAAKTMVRQKTLGVHYRGTDKHVELLRSGVSKTEPKSVYRLARDLAQYHGLDHILFCTDDATLHPPDDFIVFRHRRSLTDGLHTYTEFAMEHLEEAFVELLALSMCNHLLVCRSCFSEAALILSPPTTTYSYLN